MADTLVDIMMQSGYVKTPAIQTTIGANTVTVPIWLMAGFRTYIAVVTNSSCVASKNHILLFNGVGSGQRIIVWDIKVNPNITGTIAANSIVLNVARTSDVGTGGTIQTIKKSDTNDVNLPTQFSCVSTPTTPTITTSDLASTTILLEESNGTEGRSTLFKAESVIAGLSFNEGQGILIQQGTNAGVSAVNIFIYFTMD